MNTEKKYGADCDLTGESWAHDTLLCNGRTCIVCDDGRWTERENTYTQAD